MIRTLEGRELKIYAVTFLLQPLQIEELKAELLKSQSSSKEYSSKLATYVKIPVISLLL